MVLSGDVTPSHHSQVRSQVEHSSRKAVGADSLKVNLSQWHCWRAGHTLLYTKTVCASALRNVILVFSCFNWLIPDYSSETSWAENWVGLTEVEPHQGLCSALLRGEWQRPLADQGWEMSTGRLFYFVRHGKMKGSLKGHEKGVRVLFLSS